MNTAARRKLGLRIRVGREQAGLTQREAALRASLHYNYWGDCERGNRNISFDNILKVARVLRVDPGDLMRGLR